MYWNQRRYKPADRSKKRSRQFYDAYKITKKLHFRECSLCNNNVNDPTGLFILSCLRSVCERCKGGVTPIREHCAFCRERFFARVSVDSVRRNHLIASRVAKNVDNISCSKDNHATSCYCFTCSQFLCGECQNDHVVLRESHEIMTLIDMAALPVKDWTANANCSRHPGYHVTHCHRFNQEYELKCVLCETEDEEYEPDEELEIDSAFSQEVSKLQMLSERISKKMSLLGASLRCPHQKEQLKRHITETFKRFEQKVQEKYQELKKHTTNGDFASDAEMQVKLKEARDYATKLFNTSKHDFLSLVPKVQRRIDSLMTTINNPIATHTMSARNCYILEQRCERLQITIKCFGELASKSTSKVRRQMRPPIAYAKRMNYHTNTYHPIKIQRYNPKKKVDNNMRTCSSTRLQKTPASGGRKPYESALLNRKPLYPVQTKPRFVSKPPKETYSLDPSSLYRDRTKPRLSSKASMLTNRKPLYPYQNNARPDVKKHKENASMVSKGAQRNQPKTQASSRKSRTKLLESPKPLQTTSQNAPKKPKGNSVKGPKEIQLYDIKVQLPPKKQVAISMKQSRKSTNKPEDTSSAALLNRARSKLDKHRTQPERHLPTPECLRPPNRISGLSKHNKPDTLTNRTPKANKKQGTAKSRSKESTDAFHDQLERMRASNYQTGTQKNDNNEWIFKTKSGVPPRSSDKKAKQAGKKDDAASKRILPLKSRRVLIPGSPPGSTCNDDLLFDGNGDAVLGQLVMKQPGVAHSETRDPTRQEQMETKDENFTLKSQTPSVGKNIESQDMISDYDPAMDNDETDSLEMVLEEEKSIASLTNPTKDEQVLFQKELQLTAHQYPDDSNLIPENANTPSNQMQENAEMENNYSKDNFNDTLERIKSEIEKMCFTEKDTDIDTSKETKNEYLESKHDSNFETFDGKYNDSQFATYDNNNFDSNFEIPEMENHSLPYFENKHPDSPIETHENIYTEKHESKHIDSKFKTKEKKDMVSEFDIAKKTHPEGQFETLDKKNLDSLFEHPKTKDVDTHKETTKNAVDLDIIYGDEKINNDYISKTDTPVHATDVDLQSQTHIAKPKETKDEWRNSSKDNMNNSQLAYTSNDDSLVNDNDAQDNKVDEYTWNNKDYETKSTDRIPNKDQNRKESNNLDFRTQTADAWIYDNKESTHTQNRKPSKPMDNDIVYVQGKNVSVIMYESQDLCGDDTYAVSANTEPKTDNVHLNQTPDSEALVGLNSDTVTHDLDQIQDTDIYPHVGSKYRPQEPDLLSCNVYSEVDTLYNRDLGLHANKIREVYADEMKTDEKKDKDKLHPKRLVTDKQEESLPSESHLTNENPHESVSRDDDVAPRLVDNKQTESKPIVNDMLTANGEGSFEKNVDANDILETKQNKYIPTENENASLHTQEGNEFSKKANIDSQIKLQDDRNTQKLQVPIIQDDINSQTKWPYSQEKDKLELQTKSQVPHKPDDVDLQGKALKSQDKELESQTKSEVATQQNDMDSQRKTLKSQDKEELEAQTKSEVATQQNDIDSQTKSLESPEKEHLGLIIKPQADTDSNAESQVSPEKASNIGSNRDKLDSPEKNDSKSEKESQVSPEQNDIQEDISKTEGDANATEEHNNVSFTPEAGDEVDKSQKMDKDDHLVLTVVQNAVTGSSSEIARVKVLNQDMTPEKHGDLKATVHGPNGLEAAVEVEKVKDWSTTYRLVYCPQVAGVHKLQLVFQGKGVSDQTEFTSSDEELCLDAAMTFSGHPDLKTKCPHLMLDDQAIYKEYEISEDGTLSNTIHKRKSKDIQGIFKKFRGVIATQPFTSEIQYWEITADIVLKTQLIGMNMLLEAAVSNRDVIDNAYKCEGQKKAWGVTLARCKEHNEVCLRIWGDGLTSRHTSFPIVNEPKELVVLRLGFLLVPGKKRLAVVETSQNDLPLIIDGVEAEEPLCPSWAVYNSDLADITVRIVSGNEITIGSKEARYIYDALTQPEPEPEPEEPTTVTSAFSSLKNKLFFFS